MASSRTYCAGLRARLQGGLGLLVITGSIALSSWSFAEPSAADRETARGLMAQGDELFEKKQYAAALKNYQAGHAIAGAPSTGLAVATCLQALGKLIEAREAALEVTRIAVRPAESPAFATARADAARLADELGTRIPSIQLTVYGPATSDAVKVTVDQSPLPSAVIGLPSKVNPGHHVVTATASNFHEMTLEVDIGEREKRVLTFRLVSKETASSSAPAVPSGPASIVAPVVQTSHVSPLVYIGFGVGGLGLVTGAVTGVISLSKASDVKGECNNSVCPTKLKSTADSSRTFATVSNVTFGVGLAGVVLGVVGLLASGSSSSQSSHSARSTDRITLTPVFSPSELGFVGTF
jgi:hypothetical protein